MSTILSPIRVIIAHVRTVHVTKLPYSKLKNNCENNIDHATFPRSFFKEITHRRSTDILQGISLWPSVFRICPRAHPGP